MTPPRKGVFQRLQYLLGYRSHSRPRYVSCVIRPTHSSIIPRREELRLAFFVLQFALLYHFTSEHVGFVASTVGPSMVPTLSAKGDRVYISRFYRRGKGVKVGDLVDFEHPMVPGAGAIKRVVGLPGDFVVRDPEEAEMSERGLEGGTGKTMIQVPEGHCWLLGDNQTESRDSRTYGPLPLALIKGKVIARVWPLSEAKWLENNLQPVAEEI